MTSRLRQRWVLQRNVYQSSVSTLQNGWNPKARYFYFMQFLISRKHFNSCQPMCLRIIALICQHRKSSALTSAEVVVYTLKRLTSDITLKVFQALSISYGQVFRNHNFCLSHVNIIYFLSKLINIAVVFQRMICFEIVLCLGSSRNKCLWYENKCAFFVMCCCFLMEMNCPDAWGSKTFARGSFRAWLHHALTVAYLVTISNCAWIEIACGPKYEAILC